MKYRSLDLSALCERICENRKTLIVYHVRSDADAVGSAFALRELLRALEIPAFCACADEIPERLRFLADGVQGSVLMEEELRLDHDRVISVDSASPEQLGALYTRLNRRIDLMIDHHGKGLLYADHYVDPHASATGEILYEVAKELVRTGRLSAIPPRAIHCIYAAICSDTGCFRFENTSPKTLRYAAELLELGADRGEIHRRLFESKSAKQLRAEGEAARRMELHEGGRIASVTFPYSSKFALSLQDDHLETIIDIPRSLDGVEVAYVIKQSNELPIFRVSMRSCSDFDVSEVCARFGGGGHMRAAGCTVEAANIREADEMILRVLRELRQK